MGHCRVMGFQRKPSFSRCAGNSFVATRTIASFESESKSMLTFADLVFDVEFLANGHLPRFRGVTLRGAFGHTLKRLVCHVNHRDCSKCLLRRRCAYPVVFEGVPPENRQILRKYPNVPQPFVIWVDRGNPTVVAAGDRYRFGLRLFGSAIEFYPYVAFAVMEMGGRGIGRDRIPFRVEYIFDGQKMLHREGAVGELHQPHVQSIGGPFVADGPTGRVVLIRFMTPVRLRTEGKMDHSPDLAAVVRTALRRLRVLTYFYGNGADPIPDPAQLFQSLWEFGGHLT